MNIKCSHVVQWVLVDDLLMRRSSLYFRSLLRLKLKNKKASIMFSVISGERNSVACDVYLHRAFLSETFFNKCAMIKGLDPNLE